MTRTSVRRARPSKSKHHYRPQRVNLRELRRPETPAVTPRKIYVQNPYYEQMECGTKTVEARPNYPCLRDLVPGTVVEFSNSYSGRSFLATITSRRDGHGFWVGVLILNFELVCMCVGFYIYEFCDSMSYVLGLEIWLFWWSGMHVIRLEEIS